MRLRRYDAPLFPHEGGKTAEDKERLEWYDITKDFDPKDCDLEWLQEDVEALWLEIKEEM